jgi:TetR/AcrR family transcriptional regulator
VGCFGAGGDWLKWVAETVLAPLLARLLPQIIEVQKQGLLPAVDPILFHYMMVSLTATLSEFGPEMQVTSGLSSEDPKVVAAYWRLVEETVFGKEPNNEGGGKGYKR